MKGDNIIHETLERDGLSLSLSLSLLLLFLFPNTTNLSSVFSLDDSHWEEALVGNINSAEDYHADAKLRSQS